MSHSIKQFVVLMALICASPFNSPAQTGGDRPATFCNPLDLDYRFQLDSPSRREAADPTMVRFHGEYWLFASKSGGYWHSPDMLHWKFVKPSGLQLENYAPTVEVIKDRMYFTAGSTGGIYTTDDPVTGKWEKAGTLKSYPDPDLFLDGDGRFYCYFGCSHNGAIQAVELDPEQRFKVVRGPVDCLPSDYAHHGFEVSGEDNRGMTNKNGSVELPPWTEGSWMTKHDGVYYLQYASPGTQFKSYCDGVYTSTNPMGPFTYAPYSPFSQKATGFIGGAGHSSTFQDDAGRYWHIATMTISMRHIFERRVGLFPTAFTSDGQLYCNTYLGDYPQFAPGVRKKPAADNSPGWMLLSYHKPASASSALPNHPAENAFDEDVRKWWSATSGNSNEWLQVDLEKPCRIESVQVNFADEKANMFGRMLDDSYRYWIEISRDGTNWNTCIDHGDNRRDAPHEYTQLAQPVTARYVRLVNVHSPAGGYFSVSGFRIFGNGLGKSPSRVRDVQVERDPADGRRMHVSWKPVQGADFYIIRYGIAHDRLFNNYQVYGADHYDINSLNTGVPYYLTVDAVNDSGVTRGSHIVAIK